MPIRNVRVRRMAVLPLLVLVLLAAGGAWLWAHHTGHGTAGSAASTARSRYVGTVTLLYPGGWPNPSWTITYGPYSGDLWEYLLDYRPNGSFFPELATQVPSPANGGLRVVNGNEVITFHLKPHLSWSDGSPITPADYIAAVLVGNAPEVQLFTVPSVPCPFRTVRMSGATLVVTLDGIIPDGLENCDVVPAPWEYLQRKYHIAVSANLTASFDVARAAMYAAPAYKGSPLHRFIAKLINDVYDSPNDLFNGPYRIVSWSPTGTCVEEPNVYFTALPPDLHHPRPARIRLLTLPGDPLTGARAIARGAIPANVDAAFVLGDALRFFSPPLAFQTRPPYQIVMTAQSIEVLALNQENPALRDKRVRQALLYAIDKVTYLRRLYHFSTAQAASVANASPFARLTRFSIANQIPANPYSPAKARALLAAGYATSLSGPGRHLRLGLYTSAIPDRQRGVVILQDMWRQVGISVSVHVINQRAVGGFFSDYANGGILARGAFDLGEIKYAFSRDPVYNYYSAFDPGQIPDQDHPDGSNYGRVQDRTLFSLLSQAQNTLDDNKRRQLYIQFQRAMADQAYWIPLYDFTEPVWVKPTIGNFNPYGGPFGIYDFTWNSYQWYVQ